VKIYVALFKFNGKKIKLSLDLINQATHHEGKWWNGAVVVVVVWWWWWWQRWRWRRR
jgi:hypothetical protein